MCPMGAIMNRKLTHEIGPILMHLVQRLAKMQFRVFICVVVVVGGRLQLATKHFNCFPANYLAFEAAAAAATTRGL